MVIRLGTNGSSTGGELGRNLSGGAVLALLRLLWLEINIQYTRISQFNGIVNCAGQSEGLVHATSIVAKVHIKDFLA